jgi:hypothetical protein
MPVTSWFFTVAISGARSVVGDLEAIGLRRLAITWQFFFPMVLHRTLRRPKTSKTLEDMAARTGLTARFGSPAILVAARI